MSDPPLSDIDFKNKMVLVWTTLKFIKAKKEFTKKEIKKEPAKSSVVMDDYRKKKEEANLKRKRESEKAEKQKMTQAEIQKNYQEQKDYENTVSSDLPK